MTTEELKAVDRALTKAITHAVAFASTTPYPDDPRWSPWTRWGRPMAERCRSAREYVRADLKEPS